VWGEYDVVVAGGGMAGCGAGFAAARAGKKTLIIEALSALGGLATMGLVNIPLDFRCGLGDEMCSELEKLDGLWHRNSDPEKNKLVLDRMARKYGCELLLVTQLVDALVEDNTLKGVVIQTKAGHFAVLGKRFVDCSGDSDLVYHAGGDCESGRPGDGLSQGCSLEFIMGGVDWDKYVSSELKAGDPKWIGAISSAVAAGDLPYPIDNHLNWITHLPGRPQHCGKDEVSVCLAHSRNCRPVSNADLTRMYLEGREQVEILAAFIKKRIPGFEDAYLSYTASLLGVRESRRIKGEFTMTGMDIACGRKFDDVIAISNHGFDIHNYDGPGNIKWFKDVLPDGREAYISNPGGFGTCPPSDDGLPRVNAKELAGEGFYFYDIPYRSLVPVRLENVLAAGRNISCDMVAQSGVRLIMLCMALGEAAGVAMAMSLDAGVSPRETNVPALQQKLASLGVNIGQQYRKISALE
jgi:hypothetical protein